MGKTVRMADIAEKLGISVVSVSKALAGKPGVSEEMRAKVVALAQQMGYDGVRSRNETETTSTIGVLVSDCSFNENAFYDGICHSLIRLCAIEGLTCIMEVVTHEMERSSILPVLVTEHKVDGLICMGDIDVSYLSVVAHSGLPCVLLGVHVPNIGLDCVVHDNVGGSYALTKHLLFQGYRDIGFIGDILSDSNTMERYLGYQQALRMANIIPQESWLLKDQGKDGISSSLRLLQQLPQAFLCSCDEVAFSVIEILRQMDIKVPDNMAVCGYYDFRCATLCQPQLTTYHVDVELMTKTAINQLVGRIQQNKVNTLRYVVSGRIIIRESSKGFLF